MKQARDLKYHFSSLQSERGQVLISALALCVGILLMVGFLTQQSLQTEKTLRIPRIKSAMNSVEARIRLAALQPQTFNCPGNASAGFNSSACTINTTFSELAENIAGCSNGSSDCGVRIQNVVLTGTTLNADVVYQGDEANVAPMHLTADIPTDVLQATNYDCASIDATRPVFAGYNADGSLKCQALPVDCPAGQYASSVNVNTLALNCLPLPTASNACGPNQYLTGVTWTGGSTYTVTCAARLDPFAFSSFTPTLTVRTTPYSSPTIAPANGVCTPIGTTTTTLAATTTTTLPVTTTTCCPGAVSDTGCVGVGTMGTWDGCSAGTRADVSCGAPPTTTTTTTTTTSTTTTTVPIPTTTTTAPFCAAPGAQSWIPGGADDTNCLSISPFPWSPGSSSNPWCCSGTHHPTFGGADTVGSGSCYWICD